MKLQAAKILGLFMGLAMATGRRSNLILSAYLDIEYKCKKMLNLDRYALVLPCKLGE